MASLSPRSSLRTRSSAANKISADSAVKNWRAPRAPIVQNGNRERFASSIISQFGRFEFVSKFEIQNSKFIIASLSPQSSLRARSSAARIEISANSALSAVNSRFEIRIRNSKPETISNVRSGRKLNSPPSIGSDHSKFEIQNSKFIIASRSPQSSLRARSSGCK
jgi:hypothetical protein